MNAPQNGERITSDNQTAFLEKSALFGTKRLILTIHQSSLWRYFAALRPDFRATPWVPSGFYRKHDERRTKAMDERWLTVDDICKYLNVSNETVYKWIEQRAMPGHRVGRRWMFKQDEVDEWVRSGGAADKSDKPDTEQ
ncbi:MAG: helix-turn-helix domain-containing protein [Acidithiobacillus sp.]